MSRRRESCFPAPGKVTFMHCRRKMRRFSRRRGRLCPVSGRGEIVSRCREKVTFIHYRRKKCRLSRRRGKLCPGAEKAVSRRRGKLCPDAGESSHSVSKKNVRFSRRRGNLCPAAEKAVSRRRGKVTLIFPAPGEAVSRRRESNFPAPGKVHIHLISKKNVQVLPAPGEAVSRRRESCFPAPGKSHIHALSKKMCWFSWRQGKLCPTPESSGARFWKGSGASFRRECNFVGAAGSCVPALGKLFPGAGERSHSFTVEETCVSFFFWRRGKLCPGTGKAVSRRRGKLSSCVPAPGKLFPGAG